MWVGDIDVPQAVLSAAEAGNLVLFVGAGASRAQPSGLPDFAKLVRKIGAAAGREPSGAEIKQPDVFLGQLEDRDVDVHELVKTEISQPSSRPNSLHAAIVRVAAACRVPRIVTTNYDRHLTSAADALSLKLHIYEAPALPIGDDFDGIVYLHGSLSQPSRQLVVTDGDFGRAYLREAWAARFLERMFSTFTVVFIGYSHGDVVMQYLARSLGSDHSRYVFTDDAGNAEWRRLGLAPIYYQNVSGDHSALPEALERWGELASMGQVAHRARIAQLVSGEPPAIPEEVSYIEAALSHPERIRYFAEKAKFDDVDRRHRWFEWIQGRPAFSALFLPDKAGEPTSRDLMSWIADQYIFCEESSELALHAFRDRPWPPDMWNVIAHRLAAHEGEFPKRLNPWLQLTLQRAPDRQARLLDLMFVNKEWTNNFDLALMLFEDRTRAHLKPTLGSGPPNRPRFEVELCGNEYWLTEAWTKVFAPALDQHLEQLLCLVTEQIARVYRSLRTLDPDTTFDPIAFRRPAIERHEQDTGRNPIDVLIDAARDCIETAQTRDPLLTQRQLDIWLRSPDTILRRLAVHGWRGRTDLDSDEKLAWLREQNLLWNVPLQHEVFHLIRDALPSAGGAAAQSLIDDAIAGPPGEDDHEFASYRSYNLLGWITDSAPNLVAAAAAFEKAQSEHPEYGRGEHPDLTQYGSFGTVEDALPFTPAELHDLITRDPTEALDRLREFNTRRPALSGPTWTGALRALQACVTKYPEDGAIVAEALKADDSDIRVALIDGWDGAILDPELIEAVLTIIAGWDHDEIRGPACAMLSEGGAPKHPTPWHQVERARHLAAELWPTADVDGAIGSGDDILFEAINHPAGDLAQFWTKVVQWEWSGNESSWDGIPERVVPQLDRLVSATDHNGLLARAFFASQLHFFFAADREWCETHLLPLFDWVNEKEAAAAWQGFLTWGRWNDGLLQAGLLDGYIACSTHAHEMPEELRRQFAIHLASVALHAAADPATWLTDFIVDAPEELRLEWARQVHQALKELDPAEATKQWDRWIKAYWARRNRSVPIPFTPAEASTTAFWTVGLPGARTQSIDLVLESKAGLDPHGDFLYRLGDLDVATESNDWARLLTHLLKNTNGPHWVVAYELPKIVARLREGDPALDLTELINEAMRLGITDAADW